MIRRRYQGSPGAAPEEETFFLDLRIAESELPGVSVQRLFRWHNPGQLPVGMPLEGGNWSVTMAEHHLLAVGPPRAEAGKTSSILIPHILAHPGPVVTVTTKTDIFHATAMARAQVGNLWCYCPDGDTSFIPPGVRELRWSPICGAHEWDMALQTARSMTQTLETGTMTGGDHWKDRASAVLAPVFHWAALSGATMRDARDAVFGHADMLVGVWNWLRERGATEAASMLLSVLDAAAEEKNAIASTAARAIQAYSLGGAITSTENENFDIADFLNGGHWPCRSDTIYITAQTGDQRDLAPLVVGLLTQIQRAAYRRHRLLTANDRLGGPGSGPILFALDELYGLAPMPDLPHILSEGGSQGILITAAIQDLTLLKSRWPREAESFWTTFGHVLIFPRIRDTGTLRHISELLGEEEVQQRTETRKDAVTSAPSPLRWLAGLDQRPAQTTERVEQATYSTQRRKRYDIDGVADGPVPSNPDYVFHFGPRGWDVIRMQPYHRAAPWPAVLTAYLERALSGRVPEWRWWEANNSHNRPDTDDELPGLPVPRLRQWATRAAAEPHAVWEQKWAPRFLQAVAERDAILRGGPRQARWEIHETNAHIWCVTHGDAKLPTSPPRVVPHPAAEESRGAPATASAAPPAADGTGPAQPPQPETTAPSSPEEITHYPFEDAWTNDDQMTMYARLDSDPWPAAFQRLMAGMELAILTEKARRRKLGDTASSERFERTRRANNAAWENDPGFREEATAEHLAMIHSGNDWGWWTWLHPPQVRCVQAFLRGDDIEEPGGATAGGEAGDHSGAAAAETPRGDIASTVPSAAERAHTPSAPELTHFPFEESWTLAADDAAVRATTEDTLLPPAVTAMLQRLEWAIEEERQRRRKAGDTESVARFDRGHIRWAVESDRNPRLRADWREQLRAIRHGDDTGQGIWKWVATVHRASIQAFLRGEPISDVYADGPPSPTPPAHLFPFEEPWSFDAEVEMVLRRDGDPFPAAWNPVCQGLLTAGNAEKDRRKATGDTASITRFDALGRSIEDERAASAEVQQRGYDATAAAMARGEDLGFWRWAHWPYAQLVIAFLRGEPIGETYGAGPAPTATTTVRGAAPTAPAPETTVPPPEGWVPAWGPEDNATMDRWPGGKNPPECYVRAFREMNAAVEREVQRRRKLGDVTSSERYAHERDHFMDTFEEPEASEAWNREFLEAKARGEDVSWWARIPPGVATITRPFLRGEGVEIPARDTAGPPPAPAAPEDEGDPPTTQPPPPPPDAVPNGVSPERWREIQEQTKRERAERMSWFRSH